MFANRAENPRQKDLPKRTEKSGFQFAHMAFGQGRHVLHLGEDFPQADWLCCHGVMRDMDFMLRTNTKRSIVSPIVMAKAYSSDHQGEANSGNGYKAKQARKFFKGEFLGYQRS
jgi:hypothetical protein